MLISLLKLLEVSVGRAMKSKQAAKAVDQYNIKNMSCHFSNFGTFWIFNFSPGFIKINDFSRRNS